MSSVTPVDLDRETRPEGGSGRYRMDVPFGWEGGPGVPYGGWTVAVALRAAGMESEKERPASLAAQFLRPLAVGAPLELTVEVVRTGRRAETIEVRILQDGRVGVLAVVTASNEVPGLEYEPEHRPDPPARDDLVPLGTWIRSSGGDLPTGHHIEHYDYLVSPEHRGGETSSDGKQALTAWIRYGPGVTYDDPWIEAARACIPADTQVPAAFQRAGLLGPAGPGNSPIRGTTLDLLLHFHRTERSTEWLWAETHVQVAHAGLASGICNLWSEDGLLLATSMSQVAFLAPRPA